MKFYWGKYLVFSLCLLSFTGIVHADPQQSNAESESLPSKDAIQEALTKSSVQHSDKPILEVLSTVRKDQRATLALNLFLSITSDFELRSRVGKIILLFPLSDDGLNRRHALMLTQAYIHTLKFPLQSQRQELDSSHTFSDQIFQYKVRLLLSALLGGLPQRDDRSPSLTPVDKLNHVFDDAKKAHPDGAIATQIQACQTLLAP